MISVVIGLVVVVVGFFWWRLTSVSRGAEKRDELIMEIVNPIAEKLSDGIGVSPQEIANIAEVPQARPILYELLQQFEVLEMFPNKYKDLKSQGEAQLAFWMMHPNELQAPPAEMELLQSCRRNLEGKSADFLVYRYRMEPGHWAGEDWLLGLAGPFFENDVPYSGIASAFSRCDDKCEEVQPDELVDWFVEMVGAKTARVQD